MEVSLGATYLGKQRCRFLVWAPHAEGVELHAVSPDEKLYWITDFHVDALRLDSAVEGPQSGMLLLKPDSA